MVLRHTWGAERSFQCFIVFDFDNVRAPWPKPSSWPVCRDVEGDDALLAMWRFAIACARSSPKNDALLVATVEVMVRMVVSGATGGGTLAALALPEPVERAIRFIEEHVRQSPGRPLRLNALAKRVHVSEQHLCRLFRGSLGESPMQCAQLLRVELAGSLLERSGATVAQIADDLGYSSPFHFSRSFKQAYGMAPMTYRNAFREGQVSRPAGLMFRHHRLRHYVYENAPGQIPEAGGTAAERLAGVHHGRPTPRSRPRR
jgi:AraC-like DNA-binding protein